MTDKKSKLPELTNLERLEIQKHIDFLLSHTNPEDADLISFTQYEKYQIKKEKSK